MLSLTVISPQVTLFQWPSFFTIQNPSLRYSTSKNESKLVNTKNPPRFSRSSSKDSCFVPEFDVLTCISTYHENPDSGFSGRTPPTSVNGSVGSDELSALIQSCRNARQVRRVHAVVLKRLMNPVTYVDDNLISLCLRFEKLVVPRKVFDKMTERNVVSWTAMINGYSKLGFDDEALRLFGIRF